MNAVGIAEEEKEEGRQADENPPGDRAGQGASQDGYRKSAEHKRPSRRVDAHEHETGFNSPSVRQEN
jgi:hypothetical protein